ncbi:glucose-methanol-choline gmc oxidoreductase [Holotrichia oblita]|uniref:Glucose-methanol-choline gmc oxidoreductase n=1 Tax=Holotrichia oblita TaxID=644536 RepID=A0ACB9SN84_HOLOL|nr:glucose-methanol-choline gmc oxidoreductase [Holotrichia oblita]
MYDHPVFYGLPFSFNQSIVYNSSEALEDEAFIELYNQAKGPLRSLGGAGSLLFARSGLAPNELTNIEFLYLSSYVLSDNDGTRLQLTKETYENSIKLYTNRFLSTCFILLLHQESYGRVELRSANPFVQPKIYQGFFTDPQGKDIKAMISGIREAIELMLSPPFQKYGVELVGNPIFGCQNYEYDSDEYWECALRHLTSTGYHQIGTCKMGPESDPEAVVDHRLRVHGIKDLRVVDTSIIPVTLTGHTNVPAFMIGEKAADMIKRDYLIDL